MQGGDNGYSGESFRRNGSLQSKRVILYAVKSSCKLLFFSCERRAMYFIRPAQLYNRHAFPRVCTTQRLIYVIFLCPCVPSNLLWILLNSLCNNKKDSTLSEQFQNQENYHRKRQNRYPNSHTIDLSLSWIGNGT